MQVALDLDNIYDFRLEFISFLSGIYELFRRIPLQKLCWNSMPSRERAIDIAELIGRRCQEWGCQPQEIDWVERVFIAQLLEELMDLFDMVIGPQNTPRSIAT